MTRSILKRDVSDSDERSVLEAEQCYYCADLLLPRQVDHFRPLSRGGTNKRSNLVAACIACNSQKRGMLVHEWRQWRTANGMSWPPPASHATEPRHYADVCNDCYMGSDVNPPHGWAVAPADLALDPNGGYVGYYRCPRGHRWQCWWSIMAWAHFDCGCSWCVSRCLEDDVELREPVPLYEEA